MLLSMTIAPPQPIRLRKPVFPTAHRDGYSSCDVKAKAEAAQKSKQGDTSKAAADLLSKYMRRPVLDSSP